MLWDAVRVHFKSCITSFQPSVKETQLSKAIELEMLSNLLSFSEIATLNFEWIETLDWRYLYISLCEASS